MRPHHLALRVSDLERAAAFYSVVLGLVEVMRHLEPDGALRSIWLQADDLVLMLERTLAGEGPATGSAHLLAFAVDDLPSWERRLRDHGVKITGRTAFTLYFSDPDGHRLGVSTWDASPR